MGKKVLFVSTCCLLDNASGAAITVRTHLEVLAAAGFSCQSVTGAIMDPRRQINLDTLIPRRVLANYQSGQVVEYVRRDVTHNIVWTRSSQRRLMTPEEEKTLFQRAGAVIREQKPDIVISYGGSRVCREMRRLARENGSRVIFYLGNGEYKDKSAFHESETLMVPSNFLRRLYEERLERDVVTTRSVIIRERYLPTPIDAAKIGEACKSLQFVTYINPTLHKGVALFKRLVEMAQEQLPDTKFLLPEGRSSRELMREMGMDVHEYPNIWLIPNQADVRAIFARTRVLLYPSFWLEGFPRSVMEAQLSGIPVLGSTRGGVPEALNGGGFTLDVPERCAKNYRIIPKAHEVQPWLDILARLLNDQDAYVEANQRAIRCGQEFHPDKTGQAAIEFFSSL